MEHSGVVTRWLRWTAIAIALGACGCDALAGDDPKGTPPSSSDAGGDATTGPHPGAPSDGGASDAPSESSGDADTGPCTTTFRFVPPAGKTYGSILISGEWNNWDPKGVALTPDGNGGFSASVELQPGLVGYKLVLDGTWQLDPGARLRKYVNGVENSGVYVTDCHAPTLTVKDHHVDRPAPGQGHFTASVAFEPGKGGPAIDPASIKATLRSEDQTSSANATLAVDGASIAVDVPSLADGKYTVFVDASDTSGAKAKTARLVFWVEAQAFQWNDAVIYMAMTDRFKDGNPSNDPAPTANVDPRADYQGGDLDGVRAKIADGTFDQLGVRALWLSPFHTNPSEPWPAADGVHMTMGYHGYWPVKAREVDPRIGGEAALKALVKEAHAHGIRVLQDFVVNHVHQDHEYFQQHPQWFRTGCICGTPNCDWTTHRLDCLFASYMPDVNWTIPQVVDAWSEDAVWWIDTFDLDGLRIDAVKHVEDICTINMSWRLRSEFEQAGTPLFLTGETAMGWEGDDPAASQNDYDTISRYIGPNGLDGQADFVTYYAVPVTAFVSDSTGHNMPHVDFWTKYAGTQYPQGAIMTPYIGSHDTPRFVTLASQPATAGNQWDNIAPAPSGSDAYQRERVALGWLFGIPGAPMLYYGDEYGQWGGADPNNRVMWRGDSATLSADEQATLALTRKLGQARKELNALRRGQYLSVLNTDQQLLVFARQAGTDVALVAMTKSTTGSSQSVPIPAALGIADGTTLRDRIGGGTVQVSGGAVNISLGARGVAVLAP